MTRRIAQDLNDALHAVLAGHQDTYLLGEDIADPYGGAFGVTRGLSTAFPDRVLNTPISESAVTGVAGGLAMTGNRVFVEVMFGDFISLCFDQLVNFVSKSVTMYGRRLPMPVIVRCPVGGNRGYGPTHSQSPQKHFVGVPNLGLYELSPFHRPQAAFERTFALGEPAVFFEDKVLYTQQVMLAGSGRPACRVTPIGGEQEWVRVSLDEGSVPDRVIVAPGGLTPRVLGAMRQLLVEDELICEMLVPSRLYPLEVEPVLDAVLAADRVLVVDDGVAGGGWGTELVKTLYDNLWGRLRHPVELLQPPRAVIPAAAHLERQLLLQESTIVRALREPACQM